MIDDKNFIGHIFPQNCGDDLRVISKSDKKQGNITLYECEFLKYPCKNKLFKEKGTILKGLVRNYNIPDKYGFYFGEGIFETKRNSIEAKIYSILSKIKFRCYRNLGKDINNYYNKVLVCEEWHNFQNFCQWYLDNSKWNTFGYELEIDKDILCNIKHLETKIYSPETCLLIPMELNRFLAGDNLNSGVYNRNCKFKVQIQYNKKLHHLGTYSTFEKAKEVYAKEKKKYWFEEVNKFNLPNDLREILLKYDFNWKFN